MDNPTTGHAAIKTDAQIRRRNLWICLIVATVSTFAVDVAILPQLTPQETKDTARHLLVVAYAVFLVVWLITMLRTERLLAKRLASENAALKRDLGRLTSAMQWLYPLVSDVVIALRGGDPDTNAQISPLDFKEYVKRNNDCVTIVKQFAEQRTLPEVEGIKDKDEAAYNRIANTIRDASFAAFP